MNVLSLFDGISIARQALENCGIKVDNYYASEIDKYAIQVSKNNWPDIIHINKVQDLHYDEVKLNNIDLMIGGSPCQDLSIAKKDRKGLVGERSGLFYEYVRILKEVKPKYFILENVNSMPKEAKETITKELFGIEPIMINAALVSAQNRKRLFWVGKLVGDAYEQVKIEQPEDRGVLLRDILEENVDEKYGLKGLCEDDEKSKSMTASMWKGYGNDGVTTVRIGQIGKGGQADRIYSTDGKSVNLSANGGGRGAKTGLYHIPHGYKKEKITEEEKYPTLHAQSPSNNHLLVSPIIRKLTPIECERLQSLPDNYTDGISNSQRYKCCGNGFNCAVIEHILKHLI